MTVLSEKVKKDLTWAMRAALLEQCMSSKVLKESKEHMDVAKKFIKEEATYEQLLNLTYNPVREKHYLSTDILESCALFGLKRIMKLKEGIEAPGQRDGTGPYKDSAQRAETGDVGKKELSGEPCPMKEESEEKDPEEVAKDIKGNEETVKSGMAKVAPSERGEVLKNLRKMKEALSEGKLKTVDGKIQLLTTVLKEKGEWGEVEKAVKKAAKKEYEEAPTTQAGRGFGSALQKGVSTVKRRLTGAGEKEKEMELQTATMRAKRHAAAAEKQRLADVAKAAETAKTSTAQSYETQPGMKVQRGLEKTGGRAREILASAREQAKTALKSPAAKWVALGVTTALAVATAAYFIYKRYLSSAAKSCAAAPDRSKCMKVNKIKAIQTTVGQLEAAMRQCDSAKNPKKCYMKYAKQVAKWKGRLAKMAR